MKSNYPRLHFVERSYASDPTNWWIPNRACAEAMLRSADRQSSIIRKRKSSFVGEASADLESTKASSKFTRGRWFDDRGGHAVERTE